MERPKQLMEAKEMIPITGHNFLEDPYKWSLEQVEQLQEHMVDMIAMHKKYRDLRDADFQRRRVLWMQGVLLEINEHLRLRKTYLALKLKRKGEK